MTCKTGDAPLFSSRLTLVPWLHAGEKDENRGASPVLQVSGRLAAAVLCLAVLAGGSACGPKRPAEHTRPPVDVPERFSQSGSRAADGKWWLSFGDGRLNALIEQALSDNPGLQGTWARLAQAEATARKAGADLKPTLTGEASAGHTRTEGSGARGSSTASDLSLGLAVSYELDLWGRVRSARDAAEMDVRATRADLDAAAITLTASVADTWCRLLDSLAQIRLIDEQIATNLKYLQIVSMRARQRQARAIDVLQQQQHLEATRSQRVQAESRRDVLTHELAVLVGKAPRSSLLGVGGPLPGLPALPRTGLPADLVRRRPDIRGASLRLAGAHHTLASAAADRFPRISLTARVQTSGQKARDLFNNWLASLAANLTGPILDGGLRVAEEDRARAAAAQSLHDYGKTVLDALKEVEDALARERRLADYLASLVEQFDLSGKIVVQSRRHYINGAVNYLRVLDALRSHQVLERQILTARLDLIRNRISLYRALGGGWDLERKASGEPDEAAEATTE